MYVANPPVGDTSSHTPKRSNIIPRFFCFACNVRVARTPCLQGVACCKEPGLTTHANGWRPLPVPCSIFFPLVPHKIEIRSEEGGRREGEGYAVRLPKQITTYDNLEPTDAHLDLDTGAPKNDQYQPGGIQRLHNNPTKTKRGTYDMQGVTNQKKKISVSPHPSHGAGSSLLSAHQLHPKRTSGGIPLCSPSRPP